MATRRSRDLRSFSMLSNDLLENAKIVEFDNSDISAIFTTYVAAIMASNDSRTDGQILAKTVLHKAYTTGLTVTLRGEPMLIGEAMVAQGLWHAPGHDCRHGCPQPKPGYLQIHDFQHHNPLRAEREELAEKKRRAGRKGGELRWEKERARKAAQQQEQLPLGDTAMAGAMAPATAPAIPAAMAGGIAGAMARTAEHLDQDVETSTKKRPTGTTARRSTLPTDYPLTEPMRVWAKENARHIDVERQHQRFVSQYRATGLPMADWDEKWRLWMTDEEHKATVKQLNGRPAPYRNPAGGADELRTQLHDRRAANQ